MTAAESTYEYQVGGSLNSKAPSYVTREADLGFYQALKAGQFCYVLNSRQMGKSSLRVRTMKRLQAEGIVCVLIDLTEMGKQDMTPAKWYGGIVQYLVSGCQLQSKIQWRTWWRERRDWLSPVQLLSLFLKEVLLVEVKAKIVIFVDEIDQVLSQNFSLDDFLGLIRCCYEQRDTYPEYKRLTFALLGVATPTDLIRDKTQTPFNIGQAIQLQGFQLNEVQPLLKGLSGIIAHPEAVLREILNWTGGQPFLTQKLCQLVVRFGEFPLISAAHSCQLIEQVVRDRVVENWEVQDEPEHLRTIRDRILRNEPKVVQLLGLYQKILQKGALPADGSPEQMELRLSGLVVEKQGQLQVYNPIYQAVFNRNWIERNLEQLRPYASAIAAWKASNYQDQSCLLQGVELQQALTWALGKSLSDEDYHFLVASQDLAKQQTQQLLETTEQASQLLASARSQAKQNVRKQRMGWKWILLTAFAVAAPILLLRFSGLLQGLEWNWLDQFFRWRPLEPKDSRLAIVTIDETDLRAVGQWPIPDRIFAQALTQIKAQNPQAIGLDIYRDLPVEPGHLDLVKVFQGTPNLFGIEKVIGHRVAASPVLSQQRQVGFADQVVDGDGKVRRALLSLSLSDEEVNYSFAVKLALHYLEAEGIALEPLEGKRQPVRLGQAVFKRFTGNDGGYVRAESGGYQILLNFRGAENNFATFSLKEVLNKQIPPDTFRDRVVLIGTTAESIKDLFDTPYSSQRFPSPELMPGIVLHANIISQILSAALDGRPLLRVWSNPLEWLWIFAWTGIGTLVSWRFQSTAVIALIWLIASCGLGGGCYLAFLWGWWLPLFPAWLGLSGGIGLLLMITHRQREQLEFQLTFASLIKTYQSNPTTGRIALEYLKQSESQENQTLIEQQLAHVNQNHPIQ